MDGATLITLRLARVGFGGGDPERIREMEPTTVLDAWELLNFQADYEETALELNK